MVRSGGGIVGASLANLLLSHPDKIDLQVYEAAKQFKEIGAGIGLWERAMNVYKEVSQEFYEACVELASKPDPSDPCKFPHHFIPDECLIDP